MSKVEVYPFSRVGLAAAKGQIREDRIHIIVSVITFMVQMALMVLVFKVAADIIVVFGFNYLLNNSAEVFAR